MTGIFSDQQLSNQTPQETTNQVQPNVNQNIRPQTDNRYPNQNQPPQQMPQDQPSINTDGGKGQNAILIIGLVLMGIALGMLVLNYVF